MIEQTTRIDANTPRDPAKGHQPDCPYAAARALLLTPPKA